MIPDPPVIILRADQLPRERHRLYTTDLECLSCGRLVATFEHDAPVVLEVPRAKQHLRCQVCGGSTIVGETLASIVLGRVPWYDPAAPRRGRPLKNPPPIVEA